MKDEEKRPEIYEREKLYEEVWAEPVKIVAQSYGVSDVALAKTCRHDRCGRCCLDPRR